MENLINRVIKLDSERYKKIAGSDWPPYEAYLVGSFCEESHNYHRKLKYPVQHIDRLSGLLTKSQAFQDFFVIAMLEGKLGGTYLEIGAGDPFLCSNTYYIETLFGFSGISMDIDETLSESWAANRKNPYIVSDATKYNFSSLPNYIDYLQVDIEPPAANLVVLKEAVNHCNFGVITFEHDVWRKTDETCQVQANAHKFLIEAGYELIANNVTVSPGWGVGIDNEPIVFEDWYANPEFIRREVIDAYKTISDQPKFGDEVLMAAR